MKKSELHDFIKEIIRKIGDEYAVYPKSGGKRLGTHSTRKAAEKQLAAIHINKEEAGIPRTALPQIHTKDIKDQYMYREGNVLLSQMKPVQIERVKEEFESALEGIKRGDKIKPIMLDKRGFIVNGHHRYDAYKALGYERAPAVVVNASLKELMIKFTNESLHNWFNKEDWVRITTSGNIAGPCGTSKNKKNPDRCLPRAKAQSLSKAERAATARKKKAAGSKGKQVVSNTKKAKVTREMKEQWPKEVPSRHGDIIFKLIKVMPDRAKYALIDAETGKEWEIGGRVYNNLDQLKAAAADLIKPQGGRQSSHFGTKEDVRNLVVGLIYEAKGIEVLTEEDDRCTRLAKQKYDTWPSAYASGAVVRCRRGEIWKKKS